MKHLKVSEKKVCPKPALATLRSSDPAAPDGSCAATFTPGAPELQGGMDILGELYLRGLHALVEAVLAATDGRTVAACHGVCRAWEHHLRSGQVWRRLLATAFAREPALRHLGNLVSWEAREEEESRRAVYKLTNYPGPTDLHTPAKLLTGGLYSVLRVAGDTLISGMLDGLIKVNRSPKSSSKFIQRIYFVWIYNRLKVWSLERPGRPVRVLEGHEERVTCLATRWAEGGTMSRGEHLVSGSLDHTVRVWSLATGAMARVLKVGRGGGTVQAGEVVGLTLLPSSLAWVTASGRLEVSSWLVRPPWVQVYSWDGLPHHCLPLLDSKLGLRPAPNLLAISPDYLVAGVEGGREVATYSTTSGHRLPERDVVVAGTVTCLALTGRLLAVAWGATVEVWDLTTSTCTSLLTTALPAHQPAHLCLTDYMLVVVLRSGRVLHWPTTSLVSSSSSPTTLPLHSPPCTLGGGEAAWGRPHLSPSCLVLGSQARLGDVLVWRWSLSSPSPSTPTPPSSLPTPPPWRYRYDCAPDCSECRPPLSSPDIIDLK